MVIKMKKYIFYTTEGYTIAPNEDYEVENCQVLGIASGNDCQEAKRQLLEDNPWITEAGFSPSKFIGKELV